MSVRRISPKFAGPTKNLFDFEGVDLGQFLSYRNVTVLVGTGILSSTTLDKIRISIGRTIAEILAKN